MKDQLIFDTTDANTIADSDSVGSHTLAGDGTLITATGSALDVNIASSDISINVDLDHTEDSVRLGDGTSFFTSTSENGDIALDVHISNTSIEVTGTDFDIRDLSAATDSIEARTYDGSGTAITSTGGALDVNIASSDPLTVNDVALANTAVANAVKTLAAANTAEDVISAPLTDRKYAFVYNNDNRRMFIGASGVTVANGFPVSPRSYVELRAGAAVDLEFVSPKTGHEIRTMELS